MSNLEMIAEMIGFMPCGEDCACADEAMSFGQAPGAGEWLEGVSDVLEAEAVKADKRQAVAAFARTAETMAQVTLLLGQMIDEAVVNPQD